MTIYVVVVESIQMQMKYYTGNFESDSNLDLLEFKGMLSNNLLQRNGEHPKMISVCGNLNSYYSIEMRRTKTNFLKCVFRTGFYFDVVPIKGFLRFSRLASQF